MSAVMRRERDIMPVRKRFGSLQRLYRTKSYPTGKLRALRQEPAADENEDGNWCLVSCHGDLHKLPKTMLFLGREECDIEVQCSSVDRRHAVVTFDHYLHRFKIKDLSTLNGTYVNETKIPEQEYVILEQEDHLRLGHDHSLVFKMERLPEEVCDNQEEREVIFSQSSVAINDTNNHDNGDLPSWASKSSSVQEQDNSVLAECQGCIAEQRIEHTCGESIPEADTAHRDLDRSYSNDNIATFGLGCNTWPKKRYKGGKPSVKEIFPDMDDRPSLHVEGLIDSPHPSRILRGTAPMNVNLPDELSTVKKGTPLYGQPKWWGEEDTADLITEKSTRGSMEGADNPRITPGASNSHHNGVLEPTSPIDATNPDMPNVNPNTTTPTASSSNTAGTPEGVTNLAFTIDFGQEARAGLEGRSLGDMMPPRMRKSLRERKEKQLEKTSSSIHSSPSTNGKDKITPEKHKTIDKVKLKSAEKIAASVASRSNSEHKELSPTHQQKLEDLWSSSSTTSTIESAANKRLKMANKSVSSKSMDEDVKETSHTKDSKPGLSSVKCRSKPMGQNKANSVIRARKAISQEILSSTQQSNNSHNFLIDKMFQNSTGSVDNLKTRDTNSTMTEYDLYHEAAKYDTDRSKLSQSLDLESAKVKSDKTKDKQAKDNNKRDKKIRSKDVPTSVLRKSSESMEKEVEDKVSESGTYTIEEEKDSKEEDEARKNIDKVFGVDQVYILESSGDNLSDDLKQQLKQPSDKQGELTLNLQNLNLELEEIDRLEQLRRREPMADSLEAELGSAGPFEEEEENPKVPSDAPEWVSQWAELANQKHGNKSDMELSSPGSSISDDGSRRNGISRKRPGTGRRLPTIPPDGPSPAMSDRSATKESPKVDLTINGTTTAFIPTSNNERVKISSHVTSKYVDTDSESISLTKYGSDMESSRGKNTSRSSVASLDTDVLLRDTETVMHAMEERMGSKPRTASLSQLNDRRKSYKTNGSYSQQTVTSHDDSLTLDDSCDFESDTSSVVAVVNGDEDFVKPSLYKSPRDVLGGKSKLKIAESLPSKPSVKMSGAKSKHLESEMERKKAIEGGSCVSDILSDVNGDSTVRTCDLDTPTSGNFNRQGSKGKGQMSMTRPNRAFALRRALADGDDASTLDSSRSVSSSSIASTGFKNTRNSGSMGNLTKSSISTPQKPRRPMSGVFADRNPPDSNRSQASLGAQIVQKSRENLNSSMTRSDVGRHGIRTAKSLSIPAKYGEDHSQSSNKQRRTDSGSVLQHSRSLRVTGVSAKERSSSMTRHNSTRTNSPKMAERNAWKRRKEYDPRRAVAEAKSKQKTEKHKTDEVFNRHRGVTRSASFNNARDLKLSSFKCDSTSSTEEYSRRSSETSEVFDDGLRRGFVPYSNRTSLISSSKVSNSSADEDEIEKSARSSSAQSSQSYDSLIVTSIYQLSLKLKTQTDKTMEKLRDSDVIENGLESPLDELEHMSAISEIPAYKSANQELAGVLKNLRKLEQHIKVINKVLFPDDDGSPDTSKEKHEYMQEIERIKNELAGFQPIDTPKDEEVWKDNDTVSVESDCEELNQTEYY